MYLPKIWIICRICLKQRYGMLDLFKIHKDLSIWKLLQELGDIPVSRDDNLSNRICRICVERLIEFYNFRMECQRSHRKLTQVVQSGSNRLKEILPQEEQLSDDISQVDSEASFKSPDTTNSRVSDRSSELNRSNLNCESSKCDENIQQNIESNENVTKKNDNNLKNLENPKASLGEIDENGNENITEIFTCNICKKVFKINKWYKRHMLRHKNPLKCSLCGKVFKKQHQVRDHMNGHLGSRPYACKLCPSRFTMPSNLYKHLRNKHRKSCPRKRSN